MASLIFGINLYQNYAKKGVIFVKKCKKIKVLGVLPLDARF